MREGEWTRRAWLALGLILAVRIVSLWFNTTELFFDEAQYWVWANEPAFGYFSKPPLLAWIIGVFTGACGDSEFCVRLASPVLHTGTAVFVFLTASFLFDRRTGFWSALSYALLPAVSLSSQIISTDVPLLLFWAAALYAFLHFEKEDSTVWAVVLGLCIGLGVMSKYAMLYILPCIAIYSMLVAEKPHVLGRPRLWLALGVALACIAPNIWWNVAAPVRNGRAYRREYRVGPRFSQSWRICRVRRFAIRRHGSDHVRHLHRDAGAPASRRHEPRAMVPDCFFRAGAGHDPGSRR